jgi:hypothetical protein
MRLDPARYGSAAQRRFFHVCGLAKEKKEEFV